jgi:uncharacterized coiled-coil protein SlyX
MKQIRFFSVFLAFLTLVASTALEAKLTKRGFTVMNKSEFEAHVAYCYGISEEDAGRTKLPGYYITGWERVPPGSAKTFSVNTSFGVIFIYVETADGQVYPTTRPQSLFYVQPEEDFEVVQDFGTAEISYNSGNEKTLKKETFYKYQDGEDLTINGPLPILSELDKPSDTGKFDGIYDTHEVVRQGTDYALLFATETYQHWDQLDTPISDAEALGIELEKYGFKVDIKRNVETREDIIKILMEYANKSYQPGDQLFVYFAGHGDFSEQVSSGFIAVKDSKLSKDDSGHASYLSYARLKELLDRLACGRVMLVLDVCYGGTFDKDIALNEAPTTRGGARGIHKLKRLDLAETLKVRTRWYLSSGGKEQVQDGLSSNSPFAASLLKLLRNGAGKDGVLTIPEIERQLPLNLRVELNKAEEAWKEKHPLWTGKFTQKPVSGPFGSGKAPDKAFVFIEREKSIGGHVTAEWEPAIDSWLKLPRNAPQYADLFDLKPAHTEQFYSNEAFKVFLPPGTDSVVGDVWALDVRQMLPFLHQFHPGATVSLSGQRGAYACLRAASPEYYEIVFQFHADFNLEMLEETLVAMKNNLELAEKLKGREKMLETLEQPAEELVAGVKKEIVEIGKDITPAKEINELSLNKQFDDLADLAKRAEPQPEELNTENDLTQLKKELAEVVASLTEMTTTLETLSGNLETRLGELKTAITALDELVSNLDAKLNELEKRLTTHFDARLNELEKQLTTQLDARLNELEKQLTVHFDARLDGLEKQLTAHFDARFDTLKKVLIAQEQTLTMRLNALATEIARFKGSRDYNEGIYLMPKQFRGRLLISRDGIKTEAYSLECPAHDGNATLFVFGDAETVSIPRMALILSRMNIIADAPQDSDKDNITWTDAITAEQAYEALRLKFAARKSRVENPIETP